MAICFPPAASAESSSPAELKLLRACEGQLDDDWLVLHSVAWISRAFGAAASDGELDVLLCHPRHGILVVEVKGGGISLDYRTGEWSSTDREGRVHRIKNPFRQATKAKYGVLEKLKESPAWSRLGIGRFVIGHAVFLPDVGDARRLAGPDAPAEITGDAGDLGQLDAWLSDVMAFWMGADRERHDRIGPGGVAVVRQVFARSVSARPLLSARIGEEEERRLELTRRQFAILDLLSRHRRVVVSGGAGTGKTLIAREKAERLAGEGMRTLLVCYNRPLADHLREQVNGTELLDVASFHQLCDRWVRRAQAKLGRDLVAEARQDYPRGDHFDLLLPIALALAVDAFGPRYDAIVVDEAQDFASEFWMPIEMLLTGGEDAPLYIFIDENQDVYRRATELPVKTLPMTLDRNCRNTGHIHAAAYRYYRGDAVEAPEIEGARVETLVAGDVVKQARAIAGVVTRLVTDEGVAPHDIAVLLCFGGAKGQAEAALGASAVPRTVTWGRLESYGEGVVTVDTVARFKGLERAVVILWINGCDPTRRRETFYVGLSRAKSVLVLCGTQEECRKAIE
ncbi:NERD domain-containing protein/DEAD/DEAH box helicase [Sphingobium yanoikuyae]|uniref:NERD domain-containing protein/DEAD/DEAH box helicase n=1 Tax=Sphingobium yanoikuyae TaxID=13690 RepID=UPI002FDD2A1B